MQSWLRADKKIMRNVVSTLFRRIVAQGAHAMHRRSFAKAVSWRALGSLDTFIISSIITGHINLGAFIAGTEVVTKIGLYYFHERAWAHIKWGLR
jgi:uncharacterized membrane protein